MTITERAFSNRSYAVGNSYACKACTPEERFVSNSCYAVWNCYACEAAAIAERIVSNSCYAVRYGYACEAAAIVERFFSNACYAVGDYCIFTPGNKCVCFCFYNCIAISSAIVFCITTFNFDAFKACAIEERVVFNACYVIGYSYACEADAIFERVASNSCYAVGDYCIFTPGNKCVCFCFYNCIAIFSAIVFCIATFNFDAFKACATAERGFSNRSYVIGYSYACEACARAERGFSNRCYTIGNSYVFKAATIAECPIFNRCYAVSYCYACEAAATIERVVSNSCYTVGRAIIGNACRDGYRAAVFIGIRVTRKAFECYSSRFVGTRQDVVINAIDFKIVGGGNGAAQQ